MIWFGFVLLSLLVMVPVLAAQGRVALRGRREAALALYRGQLGEVAEEGSRGALGQTEAAEARLEIQRRLLATGETPEVLPPQPRAWRSWRLAVLVPLLPFLALVLYLQNGAPLLPAAPLAPRLQAMAAKRQEDQAMLALLQQKIATLDPKSEEARQGYVLLGKLDADMGDASAAAQAWGLALAIRSDPQLEKLRAAAAAIAKQMAQTP
ncbi:MAG TPA: c-type cytochrome biogenesis protein CcmI [Acidisoma sp.]|uniref:c-type cytochrome biogenesis protein CcmI n=1 Tax=Acidisoma sp. TaxID=1872115 RepID=UPI002B60B6DC|nr:c-type cytochrome biogenesis protein CcmI [Acidisoma sp.]HTI03138.1 c-type cytochrome biogenesis protein CcmI [Acidisoma sp.]